MVIAKMAAMAATAAAAIAVRGAGFGRVKGGELSGRPCEDIFELTSRVPGGEVVDKICCMGILSMSRLIPHCCGGESETMSAL